MQIRWPWEGKDVQPSKELPVCKKRREMRRWIIRPSGYPDKHLLFQTRRGRSVGPHLRVGYELMVVKSTSQSTHWANWVWVFVWDDGEDVLPSQLWGLLDAVEFVMSACPLCPPQKKKKQRRRRPQLTERKLQSSNANRKIVCLRMRVSISDVFLSKQVTYKFNVTVHSAGHDDIFCEHGALREPSRTNTCFVCKITYSGFWRNHSVCGSSASLL